jgi:DNA-binding MarR family transcriptional regulator
LIPEYLDHRIVRKPKDSPVRTTRQALISETGNAMQAYQRSTQAFDDAVGRAMGLNPTDLRCLDWLVDGPKSAGDISAGTGLSSAATTDLIDRLERKGLVGRVRDSDDRRRVLVAMTAEGRGEVTRFYGPLVQEGGALLADASDEQLARMRDWLVAARELTDRHRERIAG